MPPKRKLRKYSDLATGIDVATSGCERTHPKHPERANAPAALNPPKSAIVVPAARTPRYLIRLTIVAAKMPKGTDEPKRKKLPIAIALALFAKKARTISPPANGLT
jgi:hypothetical protein